VDAFLFFSSAIRVVFFNRKNTNKKIHIFFVLNN